MEGDDVACIVSRLTGEERTAMRFIARIAKSKTNVFHEKQLAVKKALRGRDIGSLLRALRAFGLVHSVRRGLWRTTSLGRRVAHHLEAQWVTGKYGIRFERR